MSEDSPTILIVDDEPDLRDAIAFDFRRNKFNVLTASCGNEAFKIVEATPNIDVVLSDVRMPNGDGIELLDKIKSRDAQNPIVIFISGFADIKLEEAYDKGVDAFFGKPFDRKALLEAVNYSIKVSKQWKARKKQRVDLELFIDVKFLKSNFAIKTRVQNIGRGGTFIATPDRNAALGEELEFKIHSPSDPAFVVSGRGIVRWLRAEADATGPVGCGVEFRSLDDGGNLNLVEVINYTRTKSFIPRK